MSKISVAFGFIVILVVLLAGGLFYIVTNQVMVNYIFNATTISTVTSTMPYANQTQIQQAQVTNMYFWSTVPYFIIVVVVIGIILIAIRGKDE